MALSIETIVRRYRAELERYAWRFVHCADAARDVVQDALVSAWHHRAELPDGAALKSWLYLTTKHKALDRLESDKALMRGGYDYKVKLDEAEHSPTGARVVERRGSLVSRMSALAATDDTGDPVSFDQVLSDAAPWVHDANPPAPDDAQMKDIQTACARLPRKQRNILACYAMSDTFEEAAAKLGCSRETVRRRVLAAAKNITDFLGKAA